MHIDIQINLYNQKLHQKTPTRKQKPFNIITLTPTLHASQLNNKKMIPKSRRDTPGITQVLPVITGYQPTRNPSQKESSAPTYTP